MRVSKHSAGAACALSLALAGAGCVLTDDKGEPAPEPGIAGKADFTDRVTVKGDLELADRGGVLMAEATEDFTEDLEYHGFELLTRGSSEIRIEVTHRGSASGLDTTLYVYGPQSGSSYASRLAFDDDTGWGKLSRLDAFVPPETGNYLIVVGTYSGLGRGHYRLEVECVSGDCLDVVVPAECPDRVAQDIHDCVDEWLAEGSYEDTRHEAFVACTTDYAGDFYMYACESNWHEPEPWCPAGLEAFMSEIMPACIEALSPLYPEDRDPLTLLARALPDEILDRLYETHSECCGATGASYTVQPPENGDEVTFEWVLDSVRQASEAPARWQMNGEVPLARFDSFAEAHSLGADFVDLLAADAGADSFRLGLMDASYYAAPGAEVWEDLFVFVFDNGVVTTIRFYAGET
jgi:hypothetical protein